MTVLDFDTWFDKYGCELEQNDMTDKEFNDYIIDKYEEYTSSYEDYMNEQYRDDLLFEGLE